MNRRRERKEQYDFYFRINYQINQGICKSIELFNTMQNLISIENFVCPPPSPLSLSISFRQIQNFKVYLEII